MPSRTRGRKVRRTEAILLAGWSNWTRDNEQEIETKQLKKLLAKEREREFWHKLIKVLPD